MRKYRWLLVLISLLMVATIAGCTRGEQSIVVFNSNGGTFITPMTVEADTELTKPTDPLKAGYVFAGWYTAADLSGNRLTFPTKIESTITLHAKWLPGDYTYTFYDADGTTVLKTQAAYTGDPIVPPAKSLKSRRRTV